MQIGVGKNGPYIVSGSIPLIKKRSVTIQKVTAAPGEK